jgi:hypothetical protein
LAAKFKQLGIPNNLIPYLPGAEQAPAAKARRQYEPLSFNSTELRSGDEDDNEAPSDEEFARWLEEYVEMVRRMEEGPSRTSPQETEAVLTPAGQGNPTAVPAIQGSFASADLPQPTEAFSG